MSVLALFGSEKRLARGIVPAAGLVMVFLLTASGLRDTSAQSSRDTSKAFYSSGTFQTAAGLGGVLIGLGLFGWARSQNRLGLSRREKVRLLPAATSRQSTHSPPFLNPDRTGSSLPVISPADDLYQKLFDSAPAALLVFSPQGDFLHANKAWEILSGMAGEELANYNLLRDPQRIASPLTLCVKQAFTGESVTISAFPYHPPGSNAPEHPFWVEAALYPITNGKSIQAVVLRLLDLTKLKVAEEKALDRYHELDQLHRLTNCLNCAGTTQQIYAASLELILMKADRASILLFDSDGVMRFKAWRGISATYRQEVEGHSPWKPDAKDPQPIAIPDVAEADWPLELKRIVLEEGIRGLACIPMVYRGRLQGKFMLYANTPREFSHEELRLAQNIASQVAFAVERKRGEEEVAHLLSIMQHQREEMDQIIASIPGVVWEVNGNPADPGERVNFISDYVEVMLGYPIQEWLSTPNFWLKVMHPEDRERASREARTLFFAKTEGSIQFRWITKSGDIIWVETHGMVVCDSYGAPRGMRGVTMDITAGKRVEEQLRQTQDMLEAQVAKRTAKLREAISEMEAFSYSVSHDLRAPLRTMRGYAQALLEDCGDKLGVVGSDYLHRISKAAARLDKLTQDLLTYSRISRSEMEVESIDLDALLTELIQQYPSFQKPAADIVIERPLLNVLAHQPSLAQCLSNLIGNAVKFVPPGTEPRVRIWTEPVHSAVRIWVVDNGIGIPSDFKERIFGMFERLHVNKGYEGTGIGLALVRKAAERMGGQVGVESSPGEGSHFWLQLPRGEP
jgi:PAS domain S-box-containing protein